MHGRRTHRATLHREPSRLPPRFERSPPPSVGFRGDTRGVPSISTLLEAAGGRQAAQNERDTRDAIRSGRSLPPPPVPESRNYWEEDASTGRSRRRYHEYMELGAERQRQHPRQLRQPTLTGSWNGHRGLPMVEITEDTESDENRALRRSPTHPANRDDDPPQPMHTIVLNPGEPLRILRSPEPMHRHDPPQPGDGEDTRRSTLPTPPHEQSAEDSLFTSDSDTITVNRPTIRRAHPLSNAWRPDSPINGLGDRIRSPASEDGWEIMRTTITPDESLPSAESSFASAAASRSFNDSSSSTQLTEPSRDSTENPENSGEDCEDSEEDQICTEEEALTSERFAENVYYHEMRTPEGRQRIAHHQSVREQDGNRFALATEPARVDIGFRLIEEALESEEGRTRVLSTRYSSTEDRSHYQDMLHTTRRLRERQLRERRARQSESAAEPAPPAPEQYGQEIRDAVHETRGQISDYFRRFTADALGSVHASALTATRTRSPPPQYQARPVDGPLSDDGTDDPADAWQAEVSRDGPQAHPVSPPAARSEREVSEALMSGDVQDLDSMRRIVERLAARDDVPEEWWMSMGLNLSRSQPRDARHSNGRIGDNSASESRVRSGRVSRSANDRGSARL